MDLKISLLTRTLTSNIETPYTIIAGQKIANGDYTNIIEECIVHLRKSTEGVRFDGDANAQLDDYSAILEIIERVLFEKHLDVDNQTAVFFLGISCLLLFAQQNFTGPVTDIRTFNLTDLQISKLDADGCKAYSHAKNLGLLVIAKIILEDNIDRLTNFRFAHLWRVRCLLIHRRLLSIPSPKHLKMCLESESVLRHEYVNSSYELKAAISIELYYLLIYHYEWKAAQKCFDDVFHCLQFRVELLGGLGKRSRYQEKAIPQLYCKAFRDSNMEVPDLSKMNVRCDEIDDVDIQDVPKNMPMDDETFYNTVQFVENTDSNITLTNLQHCAILMMLNRDKKSQVLCQQREQQLMVFVEILSQKPRVWCVQFACLAIRSQIEVHGRRKSERSLNQLTELVSLYTSDSSLSAHDRLEYVFTTDLSPMWDMQKKFAHFYFSLGLSASALQIYEQLHLWDDVIACYKKLGRPAAAEEVIRGQLAVKETPTMWCLLGDCTSDPEHYLKAWEMSNCLLSMAQRNLGFLYLSERRTNEGIQCLETCLRLNHLQQGIWFSLGCTYLTQSDFKNAIHAFFQSVQLEPDCFQSWNNLASAQIRCEQLDKAFKSLLEAVRCNFGSWQVWENLLVVSATVGEWQEVIHCFHRLLELKPKNWSIDCDILGKLVSYINVSDHERLKTKTKELLGHMTAAKSNQAEVWRQYAYLIGNCQTSDVVENEKALGFLRKAFKLSAQAPGLEKDPILLKNIATEVCTLADVHIKMADSKSGIERVQLLSTAKMDLNMIMNQCQHLHDSYMEQESKDELVAIATILHDKHQQIIHILKNRN